MVFTCVVQGCGKRPEPYVRSLHGFPNNLETIKAWSKFVKRTKPYWNGNTPSSRICSEHFQPTCYKNHMAWSMGCVRTLDLIDDFQVPTIYPAVAEKNASSLTKDDLKAGIHIQTHQKAPGSSTMLAPAEIKQEEETHCSGTTETPPIQDCHVKAEHQVMYFVRHVATQTDPPSISTNTRSVGTQLTRLSRSTGSQVKMGRDYGVCTVPLKTPRLLLQPTLVKRPSKRLRLALECEEEASSGGIASTAVQVKTSST
ncbi:THAP domain-containing protein 10-like isoform X1 [Poecilia reticulata]|uniref:THAP domain-containing protein 10-like isoform X1 n=1 Tax=Poecilia reticulata TaxID=8081 RepID=UPI0004A42813|nr:PREDICTED: THAP domain-containing protein 10-like isoform X1 [Poecilia reticulata]